MILHLVPADVWAGVGDSDSYSPTSLADEGFIHCTADEDLLIDIANTFYGWVGEALVLSIDEHELTSELRWELAPDAPGLPAFPHIYGPLNLDAVVGVRRLGRDADGRFARYERA